MKRAPAASWTIYITGCFVLLMFVLSLLQHNWTNYRVFGSYWASGVAATHGLNPYAAYPLTLRFHPSAHDPRTIFDCNLNPPFLLPLFQGLSHLTILGFIRAWTIGSVAFAAFTAALLLWRYPDIQKRQILWLLLAGSVFDTLWIGQMYLLLLFVAALAWIWLVEGRELPAAVMIGVLVAMKPNFIFWPVFLFLAGNRRLALRSFGFAVLCSVAPIPLYGVRIYREWIHATANDLHWIVPTDMSISAFFTRLGQHAVGIGLAAAIALLLAWTIWRAKPGITATSVIAVCAAILCSPIAWCHYTMVLAPALCMRRWGWPLCVAAALMMIPPSFLMIPMGGSRLPVAFAGSVYLIATSIVLGVFLAKVHDQKGLAIVADVAEPGFAG